MRHLAVVSLLSTFWVALGAEGQYQSAAAGPPPSEVAPAIAQALQKDGVKISNGGAAYCEIWFRTEKPSGAKTTEENVTLPSIPVGALVGVIRFDGKGSDRRGQTIKAGVYTLRYGIMPINGDHQGAAPQRDFLLMTPAAEDQDLNSTPAFEALVAMSRKASGTPHPAVLSVWKADSDTPGLSKQGDSDWVLQTKIGDTPIAVILVGVAAS
ncbi:MAG TPA: hypothetical protein VKT81_23165 [Bryobacteraceae bacterium]|nr:hypothetical protein [Bryobacteraceae bacterium]